MRPKDFAASLDDPTSPRRPAEKRNQRRGWAFGQYASLAVLAVYAISFAVPAVDFGRHYAGKWGPSGVGSGMEAFLHATVGYPIPWLANPFFWATAFLLFVNRPFAAVITGGVAFLLGLFVWLLPPGSDQMPGFQLLTGYFLWLASIGTLPVVAGVELLRYQAGAGK